MGPIVKQAASDYADKPVTFVTFDFTTDETTAASKAAADKYNVAELYAANEKKTGFLLVVDASSGEVIAKLSAKDDVAAYHTAIDKVLGDG